MLHSSSDSVCSSLDGRTISTHHCGAPNADAWWAKPADHVSDGVLCGVQLMTTDDITPLLEVIIRMQFFCYDALEFVFSEVESFMHAQHTGVWGLA